MSIEAWMIISLITGAFGLGYFVYGRKQSAPVPLISGILLCIYPYFLDSPVLIILVGLFLIAAPFIFKFEI